MNRSSGVVALTSSLDFETASLHTLTIRASDSAPSGAARHTDFDLQIHVEDVNDNRPKFANSSVTVQVPENLSIGKARV